MAVFLMVGSSTLSRAALATKKSPRKELPAPRLFLVVVPSGVLEVGHKCPELQLKLSP